MPSLAALIFPNVHFCPHLRLSAGQPVGKPACFPRHGSHAGLCCGRWPHDRAGGNRKGGEEVGVTGGAKADASGALWLPRTSVGFLPRAEFESPSSSTFWVRCVCVCVLGRFSRVQLFEIPRLIAGQTPLTVRFSRQEHWSGLPCPPPGDLPHPRMEPASLMSPALAGGSGEGQTNANEFQKLLC